jgi:katanin p60 ATPase-containing subunit A1
MMPMRRRLLAGVTSFSIEEIQNLEKDIEVPLTMTDFEEAIKNIQKSVSEQSLKVYDNWMKEFGAV